MDPSGEQSTRETLKPEDLYVLRTVQSGTHWLRAVLCTLARRGVAFRQEHPDRARQILESLSVSPVYKGGQFIFDLLEWEDFMIDGTPPEIVPTALDVNALNRITTLLNAVKTHLDGGLEAISWDALNSPPLPLLDQTEQLPPLEAGFYLYQDVVLGCVRSAASLPAAARPDKSD